jgi:hypothetical protein
MADPVKPGVVSAIADLAQQLPEPANDRGAQQLALAPDLAPAPAPPRGPGRPPGSANRRGRDLRDYLEARGVSPAMRLAELLGPGLSTAEAIRQLAQDTGMERAAAAELYVGVAKALLPYTEHQLASLKLEADPGMAGAIGAGVAAAASLHLSALQQLSAAAAGAGGGDNDNAIAGHAEELRDAG